MVREHGFTGPIYALAEEPIYRPPMLQIGATEVFTPAHVLGGALASRASTRISPPAEGLSLLGHDVGMIEFRVRPNSRLAGQLLGDLHLQGIRGVSVIGQWREGVFTTAKGPNTRIEPGGILVVVGPQQRLEAVERMAMPIRRTGPIIIVGYGTVGQKVGEMLRDAGEACTVIDIKPGPGVDIVGNVLDSGTLERARVKESGALILALNDDSEAVFATAALHEYAPEAPLIVRVNRTPNIERIYRAGADFAISLGQVACQILSYHLLDEQVLPVENRIKFSRTTPGSLVGSRPWSNEALDQTGVRIVAVEREHEVIVEFSDEFRLQADDTLYLCGSLDGLERCQRQFQTASIPARRDT